MRAQLGTGGRRQLLTIGVILCLAVLGAYVSEQTQAARDDPGRPVLTGSSTASYALAAGRLEHLDDLEQQEQLRDWAELGLASLLELDDVELGAHLYDRTAVRDDLIDDLVDNPVAPGRSISDGDGLLHLLVPVDDPHPARTVGSLLDDHRADHGGDPAQVQIHRYALDRATSTITYDSESVRPTTAVRSEHGYVEMPIDTSQELADYLAQAHHLSRVSIDDDRVLAGGWNWPGVPRGDITAEDVSVLQQAYLQRTPPGFSLDPGPLRDVADLAAVVPDASAAVVEAAWRAARGGDAAARDAMLEELDVLLWDPTAWPEHAAELQSAGFPSDRRQLWALRKFLNGRPAYSMARYDGGLEGSAVGMTLFYTDMVAKNWTVGVGVAVPDDAVPGFVPAVAARSPLGLCTSGDESGRLWFGQKEDAFAYGSDSVDMGGVAARLFARSDADDGSEVEPSYSFGRQLQWWDRHYRAVADYEPQYHRLDQVMRWSAALEWLVDGVGRDIALGDVTVDRGASFAAWHRDADVRETADVPFVAPPSATEEALLATPSPPYDDCGGRWIQGGVSLADSTVRRAAHEVDADLPTGLRRADLLGPQTAIDPATQTGVVQRVFLDGAGDVRGHVTHRLDAVDGGMHLTVEASGRRVVTFGQSRVARFEDAVRRFSQRLSSHDGDISVELEADGMDIGRLGVRKHESAGGSSGVTIDFTARAGAQVRTVVDAVQRRLDSGLPLEDALRQEPAGVLHRDPASGTWHQRVAGQWLRYDEHTAPDSLSADFVLRLGATRDGEVVYIDVSRSDLPGLAASPGRQTWYALDGAPSRAPVLAVVPTPDGARPRMTVSTPDGSAGTLVHGGDRWVTAVDDPVFGVDGHAAGMTLMRNMHVVDGLRALPQVPGLHWALPIDANASLLVSSDRVILAGVDHQWHEAVRRITAQLGGRPVRASLDDDRLRWVAEGGLRDVGSGDRVPVSDLTAADLEGSLTYVHPALIGDTTLLEEGGLITGALRRDVRVVRKQSSELVEPSGALIPDFRLHEGALLRRLGEGLAGATTVVVLTPDCEDDTSAACQDGA